MQQFRPKKSRAAGLSTTALETTTKFREGLAAITLMSPMGVGTRPTHFGLMIAETIGLFRLSERAAKH